MSKIQLTLACDTYDRTDALADGTVQPEGIDLNYIHLPVEETFWRMCQYHEFDISEMSLSSYMINLSRNDDFRAILSSLRVFLGMTASLSMPILALRNLKIS